MALVRTISGWVEAEVLEDRGHEVVVRIAGKRRVVDASRVKMPTSSPTSTLTVESVCYDSAGPTPVPKQTPARDPKYLAWIRTLPCWVCKTDAAPSEASHHGLRGMATKASDHEALPACTACHYHHHQTGRFPGHDGMSREEYREALQAQAERYRRKFLKLRSLTGPKKS